MTVATTWLKPWARWAYARVAPVVPAALRTRLKHARELGFWASRDLAQRDPAQVDLYYRTLLLDVAAEPDASFCADKVVADFGCGPMGSLRWLVEARERIGIDVLADAYARFGLESHAMRYVTSSETRIPLADASVDVVFTINALDHVTHLSAMCAELRRIVRPGGELIASLNLDEAPTACEPQRLSEDHIRRLLIADWETVSYRVAPKGEESDVYQHVRQASSGQACRATGPHVLWLRIRRPS